MMQIVTSTEFDRWLAELRDDRAAARITSRIARMAAGNPGDVRPVGGGLSELRIDYGPGYRVYFMRRGRSLAILLCGGEKSTQRRDIAKARTIAAGWPN